MTSVLIVDDHVLIREGVRSLLNRHSTMDICGEAKDGEEALEKLTELRPDIVLLDISMPRMNGIQAAREIHRILPSTKIVFFTAHPASLYYESRLEGNAFVSKLAAESQLIPTLNRLIQTETKGLDGSLSYDWQHSVAAALVSERDSLPFRIKVAQQAIAGRLTDLKPPDHDEQIALNKALRALRELTAGREDCPQ